MQRWLLAILLCLLIIGCNLPAEPLPPPHKPFQSDGCSCFPDLDYGDCCTDHDRLYWWGGTADARRRADDTLRQCIAAKGRPLMSHVVYWGVRIGGHGWLPTPWRWGFGRPWPEGYSTVPSSGPQGHNNLAPDRRKAK